MRYMQAHKGVEGAHAGQRALGFGWPRDVGRQRVAKVGAAGVVDAAHLGQRGVGIGEGRGGLKGGQRDHEPLSTARIACV